jgi:hypothetical protein
VDESEIIDGLKFLRRQHDLQPLFPHQAGSAFAVLHARIS